MESSFISLFVCSFYMLSLNCVKKMSKQMKTNEKYSKTDESTEKQPDTEQPSKECTSKFRRSYNNHNNSSKVINSNYKLHKTNSNKVIALSFTDIQLFQQQKRNLQLPQFDPVPMNKIIFRLNYSCKILHLEPQLIAS